MAENKGPTTSDPESLKAHLEALQRKLKLHSMPPGQLENHLKQTEAAIAQQRQTVKTMEREQSPLRKIGQNVLNVIKDYRLSEKERAMKHHLEEYSHYDKEIESRYHRTPADKLLKEQGKLKGMVDEVAYGKALQEENGTVATAIKISKEKSATIQSLMSTKAQAKTEINERSESEADADVSKRIMIGCNARIKLVRGERNEALKPVREAHQKKMELEGQIAQVQAAINKPRGRG